MGGLRGSSVLGEQGASQHLRCRPGLTVQVGSLLAPRIVCPCMPCVYVRASPSSANDTCTWPCVYMAARSTHNLGRGGATAPRAGSRRRTDRARWRGTGGGGAISEGPAGPRQPPSGPPEGTRRGAIRQRISARSSGSATRRRSDAGSAHPPTRLSQRPTRPPPPLAAAAAAAASVARWSQSPRIAGEVTIEFFFSNVLPLFSNPPQLFSKPPVNFF